MHDMDDFFAFQSTNDNNNKQGTSGCSLGCLTWMLVLIAVICIIGKLSG